MSKACLLMFASLVALDCFHLLLSTQLTTDLTSEWSGEFIFHLLSHIYAKTPFCCVETVANNALNRWRVVVFDQLWANAAPTLNTKFLLTNFIQKVEFTAFWYLQLLCYLTQFQFTIGQKEFVEFFSVFPDNCQILATEAFSIICVCTTTFKVRIPPLNHCFWRSWFRIILVKPLLCLNHIFPIRKLCFINRLNSDFSIVLKICNVTFT